MNHDVLCVECGEVMKPRTNGVRVLYLDGNRQPYEIWLADLKECPDCGKQIISGFGEGPIHRHFDEGFQKELWATLVAPQYKNHLTVIDSHKALKEEVEDE